MKTLILNLLFSVALIGADTNNITTRDGQTYTNAVIQRADPNGLVIEYAIRPGALGLAKLKFTNLNEELQTRYRFNTNSALEFEVNQKAGSDRWYARREQVRLNALAREKYWESVRVANDAQARDDAAIQQQIDRQDRIRKAGEAQKKRLADAQALRDWWDYGVNANYLRDLNPKPLEE